VSPRNSGDAALGPASNGQAIALGAAGAHPVARPPKPRRTLEGGHTGSPSMRTGRRRDRARPSGDLVHHGKDGARDRGVQTVTEVHLVWVEEIRTLLANADLDPVQRARTIAQLQRVLLRAGELQSRRVADAPPGPHFDLAAKEIEKLRANADLDPVQRARTIAQLARVQLRALEQQIAEARRGPGPDFDYAAMLEEIWEELGPELERRRRAYRETLDAERAEMSADKPNGRASNPS